jgi:WD40 repeat protein
VMTSTLNHQLRIIQAPVFAEETYEIIDANNSTYEKNILATFWTLLTSSSLPHQEVTHKKLHQISWNQSKKSFAISLSSETSLAHIFINKNGTWLTPPLFNSKQGRTTLCMTWLPFSDTLLVGTLSGVCLWRIFALSMQESEQSWMSYLPTPNHHETDFIQPSPFGRFFATACKRDRVIYIWDSYYLTSTTLFCLSSTSCVSSMEWSADGQYILVGGRYAVLLYCCIAVQVTSDIILQRWVRRGGAVRELDCARSVSTARWCWY